ncbi:retrotransposon protein, putative, ty1-copia subclass [Tanacetum coccineum]
MKDMYSPDTDVPIKNPRAIMLFVIQFKPLKLIRNHFKSKNGSAWRRRGWSRGGGVRAVGSLVSTVNCYFDVGGAAVVGGVEVARGGGDQIDRLMGRLLGLEDISNNTIIESAEADFFENIFPYKDKEKQILNPRKRVMNDQLSQDETDNNSEIPQENVEPRKKPQTFKAVMESSEAPYWKEAIQGEIDSIMHNNTWKLVDLPSGHKPIGHKWIFKKKLRPDGTIEKYKARLVAKGYRQKEGQDFFDTYSPVTRITSIRTLIAIAAIHNLIIHQMDVKTAFLNGELDEEIYMQQPEGFVVKGQEHKVCKLVKSLYGLKQAPKQWHEKFDNTLLSNDFQINECDKCVYV